MKHSVEQCVDFSEHQETITNGTTIFGNIGLMQYNISHAVSEISCERSFSIHKHIMKDRRGHVNRDLVEARVRVVTANPTGP